MDSYALPVHFELSAGQVHDIIYAEKLINESPKSCYVVADKGDDSERFREQMREQDSIPIFPRQKTAKWGMMILIDACINIGI
ncbi:transposase [Psychromonas sp.]|uniref:transposase n=1 Tax=Psychromonas sp. TaxID=1884585 RepID=UPI0039E3C980